MNQKETINDADFIERMRRFSVDHEPNGWPAVQMHQITRLCDLADANIPAVKALREEKERLKTDLGIERRSHAKLESQLAELRQGGEAIAIVENDDADSAQHPPSDPKFFVRMNLERKKILKELHDKAVELGFDSAHQAINAVEAMERAISLQETHLDKHVATIKRLQEEINTRPQPAIPPGYAMPDDLVAWLKDEAVCRTLTSHPRKFKFAAERGMSSLDEVHEWMTQVSKRGEAIFAKYTSAPDIQPQAGAPIADPELPDDVLEILRVVADFDHYDEDDEEFTQMPTDERLLVAAQKARAWFAAAPSVPVAEPSSLPERDLSKPAEQQGLFRKFEVCRVDGSDGPGGKHEGCEYFVLDMDHDKHAPAALIAYASACADTHPQLSADLLARFAAHADSKEGDE